MGAEGVVRGIAVVVAADPEPIALLGVIVNVYEVPLVRPVKVQDVLEVFVQPTGGVTAGLDVTEYVTAPPLEVEAVQEIADWAFWFEAAVGEVGAVGAVIV